MIVIRLCEECHKPLEDNGDSNYYCINEDCDMYDELQDEDDE